MYPMYSPSRGLGGRYIKHKQMKITNNASLLEFNTFGINAHARYLIEYNSIDDLQAVLNTDIVKQHKLLHVGSGSNLLFVNDFDGVVLHSQINNICIASEDDNFVFIEVGSGVIWDDFVGYAVDNNWGGIENLSLIPGETGAAAVQNIGAYGAEIQDVIATVNAIEIKTAMLRSFNKAECNYGYRDSVFKSMLKAKYIVTSVVFKLQKNPQFNLSYQHLEAEVLKNGSINLKNIRNTIIAVRKSKLPDPGVMGNAGSFFMNPVVSKSVFINILANYPEMPHYHVSATEEKIPAAWLIDQCGWKGKQVGRAGVHDKQALVLVNKGGATGQDIVNLANQIQKSVFDKFGIELLPEVNYIGEITD